MEGQLHRSILLKATLASINKHRKTPITYLKPKQIQCILTAASGTNVLGILPTGYGKSLIFEAIPVYQALSQQRATKTVVISPLNVIIDQQLATLGDAALRMQHDKLTSPNVFSDNQGDGSEDEDSDVPHRSVLQEGGFKFLVGHPEDFLEKESIKLMRSSKWAKDVSTIVIDEAHCVVQWSGDFRPKYRDLEQLRAIFPNATFVALTATASIKMRNDILRLLNMEKTRVISAQVDRNNIKYSVVRRPSNSAGVETSYTAVFVPVMEELKSRGKKFPKTVIYTSLRWCGFGNELGVKTLSSGEVTLAGVPEIAQFHAPLSAEAKKVVADELASPDGDVKLLLATEAYGMGVDTPDIRRVLHAGPPCTLETYAQTTGRAGRDGEDSEAVLFYNNEDLGRPIVTQEMRDFCRTENCRREFLCSYFGTTPSFSDVPHKCCDICAVDCTCKDCLISENRQEYLPWVEVEHSEYMEKITHSALNQVFRAINQQLRVPMDPVLFTGLTKSLARDIATNYELFVSEDALRLNYFHLRPDYIKCIFQVILSCSQFAQKSQNRE